MTSFVALFTWLWVADFSWPCGVAYLGASVCVPVAAARLSLAADGALRAFFAAALAVMLIAATSQTMLVFEQAQALEIVAPTSTHESISVEQFLFVLSTQKRGLLTFWAIAAFAGVVSATTHGLFRAKCRQMIFPKGDS